MQITSTHLDIFPTRIWTFDLSGLEPHFPSWLSELANMRAHSPASAVRSNRQGWSSDKSVFANPAFAPLREAAQAAFAHAFGQMALTAEFRYKLEAWANIHENGGYNTAHIHQNVLLCGSFYLAMPPGSGHILFRDPRPGVVLSPFYGSGANNCRLAKLSPAPGTLLVFPNWLEHEVEAHEGNTPRISIAMNAVRV